MNLSASYVRQVMWSDLEENMILEHFSSIGHDELLGWYNLSLMQTLLFNCTKLEFYVNGGVNWKRELKGCKTAGVDVQLATEGAE
jgi:predicted nuclease of restriction endonuclease-like RecB superfamily